MRSLIILATLLLTPQAWAQEGPTFAAFHIDTQLQRELIGHPEANIYLTIDGNPIADTGQAQADYVLSPAVQQGLREIIDKYSLQNPKVTVWVALSGPRVPRVQETTQQMKQIFAESTFEPKLTLNSTVLMSSPPFAEVSNYSISAEADPKPVDRMLTGRGFTAFVISSDLARRETGGADVYVTLHQPITRDFQGFPPELIARVKEAIDQLEPAKRGTVILQCKTTREGEKQLSSLTRHGNHHGVSSYPPAPTIEDPLAQDLGFKLCQIGIKGLSFAPEDLLHRFAPNFYLANQNGEPVDFREKTKGHVTVLNFSGIADAASQKLAPHLTTLQKEFADQGVKVISVNNYDESPEAIRENRKRLALEHETLVSGRSIAKDQYTVRSYPVTFFLDAKGIIRDYHFGFEPGEEAVLKEKIEALLPKKED